MTKNAKRLANPLALAVLVLLYERAMHPYEMASTLKERGKEKSIKLNYGSLYTVIGQLLRKGFIAARETLREGRHPEKTVYTLTAAGEAEMSAWLRELVEKPAKEFPRFEAALSLLPALPPEEVAHLLEQRTQALRKRLAEYAELDRLRAEISLPRLFVIEAEYDRAMTQAELEFAEALLRDIRADTDCLTSGWARLREAALHAKQRPDSAPLDYRQFFTPGVQP
ncbi:MAG TPA: PadR family transcriptional regulator [bacterium]|nr:PadR family transcriptional regulator [bacterium]